MLGTHSPCRKCGLNDRNASGKCRPCQHASYLRFRERHPGYFVKYTKEHRKQNLTKHRAWARGTVRRNKLGWAPGEHERAEAALLSVTACACCGAAEPGDKRGWIADHDHFTGKFREHLCTKCNLHVGWIEKSPQRHALVMAYLRRHSLTFE